MPVLSVQGLHKSFGKLEVLRDVSLELYSKENIAVIGHSGCGKTTLLRILCAFEYANAGQVLFEGAAHIVPCKEVLMLLQSFDQLQPWRTVLGNVMFPLLASSSRLMSEANGISMMKKDDARVWAMKHIKEVGLLGFENAYPHTLSGGMKQRAVVAMAMALRPKVLLMDEPFGSLDDITRGQLQDLTLQACDKENISIILVTHNIEEAIRMADSIIIMDRNPGRIKAVVDNSDKLALTAIMIAERKEQILMYMKK
jgi:NitT/TauT family transport system ATP-binding protein